MLLTGDAVMASEALSIGLVDELVPAEIVLTRAKAIAAVWAESQRPASR